MTGLVGFSWNRKSWVSKVIGFFRSSYMKHPPTHTFIVFGELLGEIIIGEATDPRIRLCPLSKYIDNPDKKVELFEITGLAEIDKKHVCIQLMDLVSKKYGYLQLFGFIWLWLLNKLGITADSNPFKKDMVCSEYVYFALREMEFRNDLLETLEINSIAPDHIHIALTEDIRCKKVAISDFDKKELEWLR